MTGKVCIYIQAYNAEQTIKRAIDSILNQTYDNFTCLICNNGSTDRTEKIIKKYQKKDNRIQLISISQNNNKIFFDYILSTLKERYIDTCEFFCNLDSDDEYLPDFLERSIAFMNRNQLDMCMGGTQYLDANTLTNVGERQVQEEIVLDGEMFDRIFPIYHQFTRTIWGKMFRMSVIWKMDYRKCRVVLYGGDTLFTQEAVSKSKRVGILSGMIHRYYVSSKSISNKFDSARIDADSVLFDYAVDFLFMKCGHVSNHNLRFLYAVYENALKDTLNVLMNTSIDDEEKIKNLYCMITNHHTRSLCALYHKSELFNKITDNVCFLNLFLSEDILQKSAEIFAILGIIPSDIRGTEKDKYFHLLASIRRYWFKRDYLIDIDVHIKKYLTSQPLLAELPVGAILYFEPIVGALLREENGQALEQIIGRLEAGEDIPDAYVMPFLELGLNLAANMGEQAAFIWLKKIQITAYLQMGHNQMAVQTLEDWDAIFPNDLDFKELRKKCERRKES